jgi:hypothetical protein
MTVKERVSRIAPRKAGVALAGVASAALALSAGPAFASSGTSTMHMGAASATSASSTAMVGNTAGWISGQTAKFHYTKNFVCRMPPASGATSKCELGATYDAIPSAAFDPLYVLVPIGFTPKASTLQCPVAGKCIDHPHTIDLSRVFGKGTENALLPAHSHIVTTANMGSPEWWNVIVVGVTDSSTWNKISSAKSYSEVQMLRRSGSTAVTDNIPTNLFLYFSVKK